MFTFMLVTEVTEVSGAAYCDHLSDAGRRPAGDDVPHALATCQEEMVPLKSWTHGDMASYSPTRCH